MGKRKTRKEKVNADLRNQIIRSSLDLNPQEQHHQQIVYTTRITSSPSFSQPAISYDYRHFVFDIKKTAITVTALLALQLVLFSLLRFRIVSIPFLQY